MRLDWKEPLYPSVVVRFRIPGVGHPERPVLDTIGALARGRHGLMGRRLVERGLATSVDADFRVIHVYRFGSPAAINFIAYPKRDQDIPAVERAMLDTVEDLRRGRIDASLFERARKSLRVEWEQTRTHRLGLAFTIGHFHAMDSWKTVSTHMDDRVLASLDDVARVAKRYFVLSNRVIATTRSQPERSSQ